MARNKKIAFFVLIALIVSLTLFSVGCSEQGNTTSEIPLRKIQFGSGWPMRFQFRIIYEGEVVAGIGDEVYSLTRPHSFRYDPFYTELVFVLNKEDADYYPLNVIVAWPHPFWGPVVVERFNKHITRDDDFILSVREPFNLETFYEDFGLTYPLELSDFVENWEKVSVVFHEFYRFERHMITALDIKDCEREKFGSLWPH